MSKRLAALPAVLGLVLALTACTNDPRTGSAPETPGVPAADVPTVPQVVHPWHEGATQLGVNLLWENSKADDDLVTRAKARRILDHLISPCD